jgi:hypothetical protein
MGTKRRLSVRNRNDDLLEPCAVLRVPSLDQMHRSTIARCRYVVTYGA